MKRLLYILIILLLTVPAFTSDEATELLQVPESFQGVWIVQGYSDDKGETLDTSSNGAAYCRMGATSVLTFNGERIHIERIAQTAPDKDNMIYVFLTLQNRTVYWVISRIDTQFILMQVFDREKHTELSRSVFTVRY